MKWHYYKKAKGTFDFICLLFASKHILFDKKTKMCFWLLLPEYFLHFQKIAMQSAIVSVVKNNLFVRHRKDSAYIKNKSK